MPGPQSGTRGEPQRRSPAATNGRSRVPNGWTLLLAVPVLLVIYPPLYNHPDPTVFGIPFFYWYQLAVVPIGVLCTAIVYLKGRS